MKGGFEWDERKNCTNFQKHKVWFEEAQSIWADEHAVEFFDPEHSETEDRYLRLGHSFNSGNSSHSRGSNSSRILLVVFCEREAGDVIRIISARKATLRERRDYEEGI